VGLGYTGRPQAQAPKNEYRYTSAFTGLATPVPISNTAVKQSKADGSTADAVQE